MKKSIKIWLIIASVLSLTGIVMFAVVMAAGGWDFTRLNSIKFVANTHVISDDFSNISITTDTSDVYFLVSENNECKVVLNETEKEKHTVEVVDNTLKINIRDERKWYEHITFFSFGQAKITVYLPKSAYGTLTVNQDTGDIKLPSSFIFGSIDLSGSTGDANVYSEVTGQARIRRSTGEINIAGTKVGSLNLTTSTGDVDVSRLVCAGNISIGVSTGEVELDDVSCVNFASNGSTGEISLENVIASSVMQIKRSTGDVELENSDAEKIDIVTDTGNVEGSLRTSKIFFTESDTGKIRVPHTTEGGVCEIKTDTGDIKITIR